MLRLKQIPLLLLFAVYFVNGLVYIPAQTITVDEGDHYHYAARFIKGHPEKIRPFDDASTMPVSGLNTIPRVVEQVIDPGIRKNDGGVSDIMNGRYMTLLVSALIGLYCFIWAKQLYGYRAGVIALFLFVFCPNLNAHAAFVTTDAYSALFTLTTAFYFWKFTRTHKWIHLVLLAVSLSLAQLSKQSLLHLVFIFLVLAVIHAISNRIAFRKFLVQLITVAAIVLFVINLGFQFHGTGKALEDYEFRSNTFKVFRNSMPVLAPVPLPLPEPFIAGLDLTKKIDEIGPGQPQSSGAVYILGRKQEGSGIWYYYFAQLVFKTPLLVLAALVFLVILYLRKKIPFTEGEWIAVFIITWLLAYFSFFYNSQVGIRHVLMIFPLLYVLIAAALSYFFRTVTRPGVWITAFIISILAGFYYYFPNLVAYTSEVVIPKKYAYRFTADMEYGQAGNFAKQYIRSHPDVRYPGNEPQPGKYIVSISDYLNLESKPQFNWLRNYKPVGHVRHTYLLLEVK